MLRGERGGGARRRSGGGRCLDDDDNRGAASAWTDGTGFPAPVVARPLRCRCVCPRGGCTRPALTTTTTTTKARRAPPHGPLLRAGCKGHSRRLECQGGGNRGARRRRLAGAASLAVSYATLTALPQRLSLPDAGRFHGEERGGGRRLVGGDDSAAAAKGGCRQHQVWPQVGPRR